MLISSLEKSRLTTLLSLGGLLALVFLAYSSGLNGPFVYDDWANISSNQRLHITDLSWTSLRQAALSGESGPMGRPVAMLSFGLNHVFAGLDPVAYKTTNLVIHLFNTLLVFLLARRLVHLLSPPATMEALRFGLALFAASWWALSPMQVTAVLYTVQRMSALSTTFVLAGLLIYLIGRLRLNEGRQWGWALTLSGLAVFLPVGLLTKESAVLMLGYVVVLEWYALPLPAPGRGRTALHAWPMFLALGGIAAASFYLLSHWPSVVSASAMHGFDPLERLLTETRVLSWYLKALLLPIPQEFGLIHDDWTVSRGLFEPWFTFLAACAIAALTVWCLVRIRRPTPLAFGVAWFLVGHVLESTVFPLLLVFEHRNYAPSVGLFIGLTLAGASAAQGLIQDSAARRRVQTVLAMALLGLNASVTIGRSYEWRSLHDLSVALATRHPKSPTSQFLLGAFYATLVQKETDPVRRLDFILSAEDRFRMALENDPGMASAAIARLVMYARMGGDISEDMVKAVTDAIVIGRLTPSTRSAILDIADCAIKKECTLDRARVEQIYSAALDHPDARGRTRADFLGALSEYAGDSLGDLRSALALARAAADEPGAAFSTRFLTVRWLALMGHLDEAEAELRTLAQADIARAWTASLAQWGTQISELRQRNRDLEHRPR